MSSRYNLLVPACPCASLSCPITNRKMRYDFPTRCHFHLVRRLATPASHRWLFVAWSGKCDQLGGLHYSPYSSCASSSQRGTSALNQDKRRPSEAQQSNFVELSHFNHLSCS